MHRVLFFLALIFLCSCGYRFGPGEQIAKYSTISVPYVIGDAEGALTSALIKEVSATGPLHYTSFSDGDLLLKVSIESTRMESISFQFPKQINGDGNRLVPSENRFRVLVKVCLIHNASGEGVIDPIYFVEGVDFDFLPIGSADENALEFSLGQLDSEGGARAFANSDVYEKLAKSVVDYLYSVQ